MNHEKTSLGYMKDLFGQGKSLFQTYKSMTPTKSGSTAAFGTPDLQRHQGQDVQAYGKDAEHTGVDGRPLLRTA